MSSLNSSMFQPRKLTVTAKARQPPSTIAPSLKAAALDALVKGFEQNPSLQGVPADFAELVAERLPVDYDVRLTVPNVHNEQYYKRVLQAYGNAWGQAVDVAHHGGSYKQAFCELYVAHALETFGVYEHSSTYEQSFHRPPIDGAHPAWPATYPKAPTHRVDGLPARERSGAGALDGLDLDSKLLSSPDSGWPYLEGLKSAVKASMPQYEGAGAWGAGVDRGARAAQAQAQLAAGTTVAAPAPAPTGDGKGKDAKAAPAPDAGLPSIPAALAVPYTQVAEEERRDRVRMSYARDDAVDCAVDAPGQFLREWVEPEALAAWRSSGVWPAERGDSLLTTRAKELSTLLDRVQACEDWVFNLRLQALPSHLDMELITSRLPNLTGLSLTYGAGEAGVRFARTSYGAGVRDMEGVARVLKGTDCLTTLALPACGIDDALLSTLVAGLLDNGTVTHLSLAGNGVTGVGVEWLGKLLRGGAQGCVLASLDLSDNPIGPQGGRWLGRALKHNDTLTHLQVKQCGLGDEGGARLVQGLAQGNTTLTRLGMACNGLGGRTAAGLAALFSSSPCPLETLDIAGNEVGGGDMVHVAQGLRGHTGLAAMDCRGNPGMDSQEGQLAHEAIQAQCRANESQARGGLTALAPTYTAVVTGHAQP